MCARARLPRPMSGWFGGVDRREAASLARMRRHVWREGVDFCAFGEKVGVGEEFEAEFRRGRGRERLGLVGVDWEEVSFSAFGPIAEAWPENCFDDDFEACGNGDCDEESKNPKEGSSGE